MNIGYVIKVLRKQRKMTQEQIALEAEIATSNVSRIEKGLRQPSQKVLLKIAKALDTTPSTLYAACEQPIASIPSFLEDQTAMLCHESMNHVHLSFDANDLLTLFHELSPRNKALLLEQLKTLHRWQMSTDFGAENLTENHHCKIKIR